MDTGTNQPTLGSADSHACEVATGLARFAEAIDGLARQDPRCLEPSRGRSFELAVDGLRAGWSLATLAPVSAPLMWLLEQDAARVEVIPDQAFRRRYVAAHKPLGVRGRAMGEVVTDDGVRLSLSCRLVLRLPSGIAADPRLAALALVFHAAAHAVERTRLPGAHAAVGVVVEVAEAIEAYPDADSAGEAWARHVCVQLAAELGVVDMTLVRMLVDPYSEP